MTYRHKNACRRHGICSNYQKHKKTQEQKLKERFKSDFQIRNKTRLCDSKTRTKKQKIKSWVVQNKPGNKSLLC